MGQFIFGFTAALPLIAAGALAYIQVGLAPVATSSLPFPFERLHSRNLAARSNVDAFLNSLLNCDALS
jgi:hypothetical protein